MSGYAIFVYKGELHIAHGLDSAQQLAQRMTDAVVSGEATGVLVRSVDNSLPVVEGFQEAQFWTEIVKSIKTADYNAITRDTLAGMFGIVAGTLAIPLGPRAALLTDYLATEAYTRAYDAITLGSQYIIRKMLEYFDNAETFFPEYELDPASNTSFLDARNVVIRYDPLVLDLDGDGLELVGANGSILFDHNADGIKTGTGWAGRDDGFLVRDLNGNGTIDTGRELFGVDTIKSNNTLATQGFDALKDLDSNADGQITSADAAYGELKVWQDANQDGISQSTELKTLAERGITSIGLNGTSTGPQAGQTINNNRVALSTTYTQNGQTKTVGAIDLETNNFFTEFPTQLVDETGNPVEITEQALSLPQMNGAGMVRNMQAAASLDGDFAAALTAFAAGTTRAEQRGMLDDLITKWSETSTFAPGLVGTSGVNITYNLPPNITVAQYTNMINVLEKFNGSRFYGDHTGGPRPAGFAIQSKIDPTTGNVTYSYIVSPLAQQVALLQNAYNAIKESVYGALVVQTRLKPYLDSVGLIIDETGVSFDTTALVQMLDAKKAADEGNAIWDLADLNRTFLPSLQTMGFDSIQKLDDWVRALSTDSPIRAELAANGVIVADANTQAINGTGLADIYLGDSANNTFSGGAGNDILNGGAGNDKLTGGIGNDTYLFGRGSGHDTIYSQDASVGKLDVIQLGAGITINDVTIKRSRDDLLLTIRDTADTIHVDRQFSSNTITPIDQVRFADGTILNAAKIKEIVLTATNEFDGLYGDGTNNTFSGLDGNDYIEGRGGDDTLNGDEGNDTIHGGDGNDLLDGGIDGDWLTGGNGNDTVTGGEGNDNLWGDSGDDILNGGEGYDELNGGFGSDTYLFGKGSDRDVIRNSDTTTGKLDVIQLAAGITTADVTIKRDGIHLVLSINGTDDELLVFGHFGSYWNPGGQIDEIKFADGTTWNAAKLKEIVLIATDGNDILRGYETNDTLSGLGGADTIYGGAGNDKLNGNDGNDTLSGDEGDDILDGGAGNDRLDGGTGSDTYMFGRGSGQDVISQPDGSTNTLDVVQLGAGITTNDVTVKRYSDSLVISINGSNDTIYVYGHFSVNSNYQAPIDQVRFADGTIWDAAKLKEMVRIATKNNDMLYGDEADETLSGLDGQDTIYGNAGNDTLNGDGGHDIIYGGIGNDTLDGGTGNDRLDGGAGSDTYLFGRGYGQDTINAYDNTVGKLDVVQLGAGILPGDVELKRVGSNLVLSIKGTSDTLQVNNYFRSETDTAYQVEQIKFADGTIWNTAAVKAKILIGSAVNDKIVGFIGDDILEGGAGNDTLDGSTGNDTLRGGLGDDQLTGGKGSDTFVYKSGEGRDVILRAGDETNETETLKLIDLLPSQVKFFRDGSDLLVQVSPSRSDVIRVQNHFDAFSTGQHFLDQVVFADGSVMNSSTFSNMATNYVNSLNIIKGSIFSRSENGTNQNDAIYGRNGHDKLTGGLGDDYLYGGGGNDTYVFRKGDGRDVIDIFKHAILPFSNKETLHLINTDSTEVLLRRDEYDLLVYIQSSPNDQIRVIDHFGSTKQSDAAIDKVVFANGSSWNATTIREKVLVPTANDDKIRGHSSSDQLSGGDGDDTLWGYEGNDTMYGDNGNDSLYGGKGNDKLIGGRGDDRLQGDDGNDTFIFSKGDGKDTLYVSSEHGGYSNYTETLVLNDMNSSDVRLYQQGTSLYVQQKGSSTDHVQIADHFYSSFSELDQLIFADGSIWDTATINGVVNGTINPDTLKIAQDQEYV